jgi:hypothetical protein
MRTWTSLALLLLLAVRVEAAPQFTDGDFAPVDWEIVVFSFKYSGGAFPGGAVTASQETGGYPGTLRKINDMVVAAPSANDYSSTWGAHLRAGAVWDPMAQTQGPIGTLDYDEDAFLFAPNGDGQLTGLAVRQGGVVYVRPVDVTPDVAWTHKSRAGITAADLYAITDAGQVFTSHPDFSASGGPIQFGFLRANSNGFGGSSYTLSGAIDNWSVGVNAPCTTPSECDDTDACTTDDCASGACTHTRLDCSDGDSCTIDGCAGGTCTHETLLCDDGDGCTDDQCSNTVCGSTPKSCADTNPCTLDGCVAGACTATPAAPFDLVEARIGDLINLVKNGPCAEEPLVRAVSKKLLKKLAKARARVAAADTASKAAAITRLLGKADHLLDVAQALLATAVDRHLLSAECAATLRGFLDELRVCVAGAG